MSTVMGFSKKQFRYLEIIVLLNAMALSLVIPAVTSSGEIITPDRQQFQHGSTSCVISGSSNCVSNAITFSTSFLTVPQERCFLNGTSTIPTGTLPLPITMFDNKTTIFNMPAAITQVMGNQHWFKFNSQPPIAFVEIGGTVLTASQNTSAILMPQWSNNGVNFNTVESSPGVPLTFDIGHTGFHLSTGATTSEPIIQQGGPPIWWRIVSRGGKGAGDNPSFSMIFLNFDVSSLSAITTFASPDILNPTTQFECIANAFPPISSIASSTIVMDWEVWACSDGSSNC